MMYFLIIFISLFNLYFYIVLATELRGDVLKTLVDRKIADTLQKCRSKTSPCLALLEYKDATTLVTGCITEYSNMDRAEKKNYMITKVKSCVTGQSPAGYLQLEWTVRSGVATQLRGVCRNCFAACYDCGHTYIDEICKQVKEGAVSGVSDFSDPEQE